MLNSQLTGEQAIEQLNTAREEIVNLQEEIASIRNSFKKYQIYQSDRELKIPANVEFLYNQLVFLRQVDEKFINIVIKNDKIIRLEAIVPKT